jgi:hypothetical protein
MEYFKKVFWICDNENCQFVNQPACPHDTIFEYKQHCPALVTRYIVSFDNRIY